MKLIITASLLACSYISIGQKIIFDQVKPVSGKRQIITEMVPIFKMKVIETAAMAELSPTDSIYTVAFYQKLGGYPITTDAKADTTNLVCVIVLENGNRVTGKYLQSSDGYGMKVLSYSFSPSVFRALSESNATACSLGSPYGAWDFPLDKKYQDNIMRVCSAVLKKI